MGFKLCPALHKPQQGHSSNTPRACLWRVVTALIVESAIQTCTAGLGPSSAGLEAQQAEGLQVRPGDQAVNLGN